MSPLANSFLKVDDLNRMEPFYPLHLRLCAACFLVQLPPVVKAEEIFSDYAYFSSFSDSWLDHVSTYVDAVTQRFRLNDQSWVVEIASNDGYLLQYFVARGIPVLGIEPARNVAEEALRKGIPTQSRFFGNSVARDLTAGGKRADLIVGNNVLAHVPDLNDFVGGMKALLADTGVISLEFPHLIRMIEGNQFDTIYHEHLSYFSLIAVRHLFKRHGLRIFDVEELSTHGGSLRIYACHQHSEENSTGEGVGHLIAREKSAGYTSIEHYRSFENHVRKTKRGLLEFLIAAKDAGQSVVGYGAPAKGNTLLNYCGVGTDLIEYTVDRSPHKQGRFLPGSHIPICSPERVGQTKPDYVLILPWNIKEEIMDQMKHIREWNGRFVVPIPEVTVY